MFVCDHGCNNKIVFRGFCVLTLVLELNGDFTPIFRLCDFTFNFQNEIRFALVLLIALNGVSSP
jgi:hypothetical protein